MKGMFKRAFGSFEPVDDKAQKIFKKHQLGDVQAQALFCLGMSKESEGLFPSFFLRTPPFYRDCYF